MSNSIISPSPASSIKSCNSEKFPGSPAVNGSLESVSSIALAPNCSTSVVSSDKSKLSCVSLITSSLSAAATALTDTNAKIINAINRTRVFNLSIFNSP